MGNAVTIDDVLLVIDKMAQETKARFEETDRQIKAIGKETDTRIQEINRKIMELYGPEGENVEYISATQLEQKFKDLGVYIDTIIVEHKLEEMGKGIIAEIDIFLSNDEYAVVIEVKSKPSIKDVDEHIKRMGKVKDYAARHNDNRKYIGVIAGMVILVHVRRHAFKCGFILITPSGDSMKLECPKNFNIKKW